MLNHMPSRLRSIGVLLSVSGLATFAHADSLYSNASANPSLPALAAVSSAGNGAPAPNGAFWSEVGDGGALMGANRLAGFALHAASGATNALSYRVADDFVVPAGQSWSVTDLTFYVYSPGFASASLVNSANVNVWTGQPGLPGSQLVVQVASLPTSSAPTSIYRVFTTTVGPVISSPDTTRRIWTVNLPLSMHLDAGTYWIELQLAPTTPGTPIYAVPATLDNGRNAPGWNALQNSTNAGGAWVPLADPGKNALPAPLTQDLAFLIAGSLGSICDSIDFNNDGSFFDPTDFEAFLSVFSEGPCVPQGATCNDIDFNNDGSFFDPADVDSFFSVYSEGPCL